MARDGDADHDGVGQLGGELEERDTVQVGRAVDECEDPEREDRPRGDVARRDRLRRAHAQHHPAQVEREGREDHGEKDDRVPHAARLREDLDGADEDPSGDDREHEAQAEHAVGQLPKPVRLPGDVADAQELGAGVDDEPEPTDEREREADDAEVRRAEAAREQEHAGEAEDARSDLAREERGEAADEDAPAPDLLGRRRSRLSRYVAQIKR